MTAVEKEVKILDIITFLKQEVILVLRELSFLILCNPELRNCVR